MRLAISVSHPIQYLSPLFRELSRRLDIHVFYAHRADRNDQSGAGYGVQFDWDVDLLSGYSHSFLRNVAVNPGLDSFASCDTPEIASLLRAGKFDALLVQGWHFKSYIQAIVAAKKLRMPVLARGDSHLGTPRSVAKRALKYAAYPGLLRVFDAALYAGQKSKEYWTHYLYPQNRLFFSPHGVDAAWFSGRATNEARLMIREKLGMRSDAKAVLFAGRLVDFKRPLDLISAAHLLRTQGLQVEVLVAGSGPLLHELRSFAQEKLVPLSCLGFCNQTEMPSAYAASDILAITSDENETWGLVANEALACGRPIVVSDAAGCAPDLVGDETVGRVFPKSDIGALTAALRSVFNNPPTVDAIANKSRQYSITIACDGIVAALSATC